MAIKIKAELPGAAARELAPMAYAVFNERKKEIPAVGAAADRLEGELRRTGADRGR